MRRAAGATTGEVNGVRWQLGANYFEDAGFTGQAANGQTVSNDDSQETQASASHRMAARHARLGSAGVGAVSSTPSAARPARSARIPRIVMPASIPSLAARPSGSAAESALMQPWFGASSRVRQRVEFDARGLRPRVQEPVRSLGRQHPPRPRARADRCVGACRDRILCRLRVARRARRQHVHHLGPDIGGNARSSAACLGLFGEGRWNAGDRATITAGVRGERITRDALPGDPLAFQPRPAFPDETINSVNPKIAASFLRRRRARACVAHSAPASVRPMRSRSRSPTTRD